MILSHQVNQFKELATWPRLLKKDYRLLIKRGLTKNKPSMMQRLVSISEATGDTYALAEAYTDYANADQTQHNLWSSYQRAEAAVQQQQQPSQPVPVSREQREQRLPHEMDVYDVAKVCGLDPKYYLSYKQHYTCLKQRKRLIKLCHYSGNRVFGTTYSRPRRKH
jgi:hypothetical protein